MTRRKSECTDSTVLKRVYLLIGLLFVLAVVVAVLLLRHTRDQERLYDRIGNYHAPMIYYTDKLDAALELIEHSLQHSGKAREETHLIPTLQNPAYTIGSYLQAIQKLNGGTDFPEAENALHRLQREVGNLIGILNNLSTETGNSKPASLPALIKSVQFRTRQLNRLHVNASAKLRQNSSNRPSVILPC